MGAECYGKRGALRLPPSSMLGDRSEGPSLARWRRCSVSIVGTANALRHLRLEILHVLPVRLGHHPVPVRKRRQSSHRQHPVEVSLLPVRVGYKRSCERRYGKRKKKGFAQGVTKLVQNTTRRAS